MGLTVSTRDTATFLVSLFLWLITYSVKSTILIPQLNLSGFDSNTLVPIMCFCSGLGSLWCLVDYCLKELGNQVIAFLFNMTNKLNCTSLSLEKSFHPLKWFCGCSLCHISEQF